MSQTLIIVPTFDDTNYVLVFGLILCLDKNTCLQRYFTGILLFRSASESEDFRFPVSRPDDVSSRPDAHLSLFHPSRRHAIPSGRQTDQPSSVRTTCIFVRTIRCVEKFLSNLNPFGRLSSPSRRLSVLDHL
jgi:hypothetical protein